MDPASGDAPTVSALVQVGRVSVLQGHRGGGSNEIRVHCDCPRRTLMSTVSRSVVDASGEPEHRQASSPEVSTSPVLFAQLGETACRAGRQLRMHSGRLLLRGETVLVSGGVPHFSHFSQLSESYTSESQESAPVLSGQVKSFGGRENLLVALTCAYTNMDGVCLFYNSSDPQITETDAVACRGSLQLSCRQELLRQPQLMLQGRVMSCDSVARHVAADSRVRPVHSEDLRHITEGSAFVLALPTVSTASSSDSEIALRPGRRPAPLRPPQSRALLVAAGRCLLRTDSLLILSGLLCCPDGHWRRVKSGGHPACLCGRSVLANRLRHLSLRELVVADPVHYSKHENLTEASAKPKSAGLGQPLLLSNVWLYSQGGSVFIGPTPLMTQATLSVAPTEPAVALSDVADTQKAWRLFLQSGSFSVTADGVLRATSGVAWMRAKKCPLGPGPSDQLTVRDALVFQLPTEPQDVVRYSGRDLIYNGGILFLDDLTPLLAGGRLSVGQQEVPLDWLGSTANDVLPPEQKPVNLSNQSGEDINLSFNLTSQVEIELLTNGACLLESGGRLHLLRGRLRLPGEPSLILVDQGVAHFAPDTRVPRGAIVAFPPPMLCGRPLTRPCETRQCANWIDQRTDRASFQNARLSLRADTVWLNDRLPLLRGCRLLLNGRWYDPQETARNTAVEYSGQQLVQTHGFTGHYSVFSNAKTEALVFSLKARFADGLQFLFGP